MFVNLRLNQAARKGEAVGMARRLRIEFPSAMHRWSHGWLNRCNPDLQLFRAALSTTQKATKTNNQRPDPRPPDRLVFSGRGGS